MSNEMDMHPEKHGLYKKNSMQEQKQKQKATSAFRGTGLKNKIKSNNSKRKNNLDENDFQ